MVKCSAKTKAGSACKANAINGTKFCRAHKDSEKSAAKAVKK